ARDPEAIAGFRPVHLDLDHSAPPACRPELAVARLRGARLQGGSCSRVGILASCCLVTILPFALTAWQPLSRFRERARYRNTRCGNEHAGNAGSVQMLGKEQARQRRRTARKEAEMAMNEGRIAVMARVSGRVQGVG